MSNKLKFFVSSSPHVRSDEDTRSIMLDVIIALIPALAVSVYIFGWRALALTCVSVASAVIWEWLYRKVMKKHCTISDLSAVVTGMLLAYCLPVTTPYWMAVCGTFFAIVIVKQLYGGIGKNFMNPALAGRAFMLSWPVVMTTWTAPGSAVSVFGSNADAVTTATPMASLAAGTLPEGVTFMQMFLGNIGGCLGETCSLVLLLGGIYLVIRKVISPRIPLAYLLTVAVITFIFPRGNDNLAWMIANLTGGGLMLGAIFMATDYVTSPVTAKGQIVFGIGCGLLTVFIRYFGSYAEGVSFAILIMNAFVWLIDKAFPRRRFGVSAEEQKKLRAAAKEEKRLARQAAAEAE